MPFLSELAVAVVWNPSRISAMIRVIILVASLSAIPAWGQTAQLNVAPSPSFEVSADASIGWIPIGAVPQGDQHGIRVVETTARTGRQSLQITPGPVGAVTGTFQFPDHNGGEGKKERTAEGGVRGARTYAMRLDSGIARLHAEVWIKRSEPEPIRLYALWSTRRDRRSVIEIDRSETTQPTATQVGWERLVLDAPCPATAHQVQLCVESDSRFWMDDVTLRFVRKPRTDLLVDQLGYASDSGTKTVVLQSSTPLTGLAPARLVDFDSDNPVWEGRWHAHGRLPAWDQWHWTADFSSITRPGKYVVVTGVGQQDVQSPPFEIADDLLTERTARPAYRFYYYQRCGAEIPGFHAACHLDDAVLPDGTHKDVAGGWHDAGDYNKYNGLTPEAVYALALAYHQKPLLFDRWDEDENGLADILDEAAWGARWVLKMLDQEKLELLADVYSGYRYWGPPEKETDNRPNTGDERPIRAGQGNLAPCVAGFALLGKPLAAASDKKSATFGRELIELAERIHAKTGGGIDQLVPLYAATGRDKYRDAARDRAAVLLAGQPKEGIHGFRELAQFALAFPDDARTSQILPLGSQRVRELAALCDARFGVALRPEARGQLTYCRSYQDVSDWYVGETSTRLDVAIDALLAARLGARGGRAIARNQVHWLLGRNPFGLSYMEGVGSHHVPMYHHRYNAIPGNPRGAVPGALINGAIRAWPHIDRPWLDTTPEPNPDYHSNEPWLLHNNRWLMLLAWS